MKSKVFKGIESDPAGFKKPIKAYSKSVDRLPNSDSAMQKMLFDFSKSSVVNVKVGKKQSFIPVQPNSRARRLYTMRGSRAIMPGRPKVGSKRPKVKEKHHLITSVLNNKGASKKH